MNRARIVGVLISVLPLLNVSSVAAQTNPRLGTWKLNVAKSKYEGAPPPKSETRTYTAASDGAVTLTASTVLKDGTIVTTSYTAQYDGKPYPYKGVNGDMITVKVVDAYQTDSTVTKGGKVVQTARSRVSTDGRTLTVITEGTDARGNASNSTRVYDKQ
jgi:hypothetical protein